MKHRFPVVLSLAVLVCFSFPASTAAQQKSSPDRAVIVEIVDLLKQLGYVPGTATNRIDTETEFALTLYLKADQPPDVAGLKGTYDEDAVRYRDSLKAALARRTAGENQPEIFIETPHGRTGAKIAVDAAGSGAAPSVCGGGSELSPPPPQPAMIRKALSTASRVELVTMAEEAIGHRGDVPLAVEP